MNIATAVEAVSMKLGEGYTMKWKQRDDGKIALYLNYCDISKLYVYDIDEMIAFLQGALVVLEFSSGDILVKKES